MRKSLTLNAVALITATLGANALGLVFWAEAAHLEPPPAIGRASAVIAAMTLLAMIAQLNLTNVFIRFLPAAGALGEGLVTRGYLAVVCLAFAVAAGYSVSGLSNHVVTGTWGSRALFVLAVPVVAVFALEDSVLTGLRLAPWVTVENVSAAACRVALLPLLAVPALRGNIVASWMVPMAAAVIVVSALLFRRVLPALATVTGTLPRRRRLLSFVAGEYAGNICATASVQVMPLLVVWRLGATQAAYLTFPWLIATGISLVMWNVASSFVVEAVGGRGRHSTLLRRSMLLWAGIVIGAVIVCVLGARPLLELVGARYVAHSSALLRLVGLSAPFTALVVLYCSLAWLEQRVWLLAAFQATVAVMLLSMTLALLPHTGLVAVGWAYLGTQALSAAAVTPFTVRWMRRGELVRAR